MKVDLHPLQARLPGQCQGLLGELLGAGRGWPLIHLDAEQVSVDAAGVVPDRVAVGELLQPLGQVPDGAAHDPRLARPVPQDLHRVARITVAEAEGRLGVGRHGPGQLGPAQAEAGLHLRRPGVALAAQEDQLAQSPLSRGRGVLAQVLKAARQHMSRHLLGPGEARLHLLVHGVNAAAADGVVGVVLEQLGPGHTQQVILVWHARLPGEQRGGLHVAGEQVLQLEVALLEVQARREGSRQQGRVAGPAQLATVLRQPPGEARFQGGEVAVVRGEEPGAFLSVQRGHRNGELRLGPGMIRTRGQQDLGRLAPPGQVPTHPAQLSGRLLRIPGEPRAQAIPQRVLVGQHPLAAGRPPPEQLRFSRRIVAGPPGKDGGVDPLPGEDPRQVGHMAERVRHIAALHGAAHAPGQLPAALQVAGQRLSAHQELVGLHIPGPGDQPARGHELAHAGLTLRAHLQVVIQQDALAVQGEAVLRVPVKQAQHIIQRLHQPGAEALKGQVPLAVPVGGWDHMETVRHLRSARRARAPPWARRSWRNRSR